MKAVFYSHDLYFIVKRVTNKFSGQLALSLSQRSNSLTFTGNLKLSQGPKQQTHQCLVKTTTKFGVFEEDFQKQYLLIINNSKSRLWTSHSAGKSMVCRGSSTLSLTQTAHQFA